MGRTHRRIDRDTRLDMYSATDARVAYARVARLREQEQRAELIPLDRDERISSVMFLSIVDTADYLKGK